MAEECQKPSPFYAYSPHSARARNGERPHSRLTLPITIMGGLQDSLPSRLLAPMPQVLPFLLTGALTSYPETHN